MNGVLGHDSALLRSETTWAGDMNFGFAPMQDQMLNLTTSSPARYHCTADAPS